MFLGGKRERRVGSEAANLVSSILVNYPEIGQVSFDAGKGNVLDCCYIIRGARERNRYEDLGALVQESVEAYHRLGKLPEGSIEIYLEGQAHLTFLHILRDLGTLTQGELAMINDLVCEWFGEAVACEDASWPDEAEMDARDAEIDRMLASMRHERWSGRLIGIREGTKVVVYRK